MAGYVTNIEEKTLNNQNFRQVLFTAPHSQLVVMTLKVGEDIGMEVHEVDQFFRIEKGTARVMLNGNQQDVKEGDAIVVPAGTEHNLTNTGSEPLMLYTIYSPAQHRDGTIHRTKQEALADEQDHL
jgi:mannose-6-phosphate isomerase-like protein (cupin superfamily)